MQTIIPVVFQSLSRVQLFVTPWTTYSTPGSPNPSVSQLMSTVCIICRMDKQQGPTVQQRELYLVSCNKP